MSAPQPPIDPQNPESGEAGDPAREEQDPRLPNPGERESGAPAPQYAPPVAPPGTGEAPAYGAPAAPGAAPAYGAAPAPSAPPHPYAQPQDRRAGRPPGRGLAIAAMAAGLAALVTVAVGAFYFQVGAIIGVILALAAIVLAIIALVKRQPPLPSIVGLGSAVLAIVASIIVGVIAFGTALSANVAAQGGGDASAPGPGGTPTVEWPANYASGGLILTKDGSGIGVVPSEALGDNALPTPDAAGDAESRIHIYLDYRCPYCAMFEDANRDTIEQVLESGAADIELTPLTFLDKASAGSLYSSRTAGALACIADAQPDVAWDAHALLASSEFQPAEGIAGPTDEELIGALDDATGGLDDEVRTCIEEGRFVPFAQALNDWVFTNPVPDANDQTLTVTGTPFVIVNGEPYPGDPADAAAFRAFLEAQGVALD